MEKIVSMGLISLLSLYYSNLACAQPEGADRSQKSDLIVLMNGRIIETKVLEVTVDQIRFEESSYQEVSQASMAISEVLMIDYQNKHKRNEFFIKPSFAGIWYAKEYGPNNSTTIEICQIAGDDYSLEYEMPLSSGYFKETGRKEGDCIVFNSQTIPKVSLSKQGLTILMNNKEYYPFGYIVYIAYWENYYAEIQLNNQQQRIESAQQRISDLYQVESSDTFGTTAYAKIEPALDRLQSEKDKLPAIEKKFKQSQEKLSFLKTAL